MNHVYMVECQDEAVLHANAFYPPDGPSRLCPACFGWSREWYSSPFTFGMYLAVLAKARVARSDVVGYVVMPVRVADRLDELGVIGARRRVCVEFGTQAELAGYFPIPSLAAQPEGLAGPVCEVCERARLNEVFAVRLQSHLVAGGLGVVMDTEGRMYLTDRAATQASADLRRMSVRLRKIAAVMEPTTEPAITLETVPKLRDRCW